MAGWGCSAVQQVMLPKVCQLGTEFPPKVCEPSAWIEYQHYEPFDSGFTPHNGGTITTLGEVITEALPVRIAFGFQRVNEDWGEASWTAGDLR